MKIKEFNIITNIANDKTMTPIEKELATARVMEPTLTNEQIIGMSIEDFGTLIGTGNEFDMDADIASEFVANKEQFILDGSVTDFKFTVGQMIKIQIAMKQDSMDYIHTVLASVYNHKSMTFEEKEVFLKENGEASFAAPFIKILSNKYIR